ncbi:hypothetical protein F5051DRAFT_32047 [Lentinula edodes]|nr:hypothetical protein F5051DRAFT_32047 [Lentinula edodes]
MSALRQNLLNLRILLQLYRFPVLSLIQILCVNIVESSLNCCLDIDIDTIDTILTVTDQKPASFCFVCTIVRIGLLNSCLTSPPHLTSCHGIPLLDV